MDPAAISRLGLAFPPSATLPTSAKVPYNAYAYPFEHQYGLG